VLVLVANATSPQVETPRRTSLEAVDHYYWIASPYLPGRDRNLVAREIHISGRLLLDRRLAILRRIARSNLKLVLEFI